MDLDFTTGEAVIVALGIVAICIYLMVANIVAVSRLSKASRSMRRLTRVVESKLEIEAVPTSDVDKLIKQLDKRGSQWSSLTVEPVSQSSAGNRFKTTMSADTIAGIQDALAEGALSKQAIADKFGVSRHQVFRLLKKNTGFNTKEMK